MDLGAILDSDFDVDSQFSDPNPEHDLEPALDHLQAAIFAQLDDFESSQEVDLHDEDEPWDIEDAEVMDFFDPQSPLSSIGRNDSDSESDMFMDDRAGESYNDGDEEEDEGDDDEIVVIAENPHPIALPRAPERDREERARQREARQRDYNGGSGQRERRRSASPAARRYVPDMHRPGVDELIDLDFFPPRRNQPRNLHQQPRQQPHLVMNAAVIDLTDEPDSPPAHRNPRRQMSNSQRNPPALARSDGSLLGARNPRSQPPGGRAPFIDLTLEESPEHAAQNQDDAMDLNDDEVLFVRNSRRPESVMPLGLNDIVHFADLANGLAHGVLHRLVGHRFRHVIQQQPDPNPLRANMPDLNYVRAVRSDKPAYEEPAVAPEGFTRETGQLAEDEILVCPSCDAELAYDPDSEDEPTTPNKTSSKGTRGKKTKEQRFWLVKECGHVYCRKCFNNRRPTHKLWSTTTWRLEDGTCADGTRWTNTPQQPQNQGRRRAIPTLCAVEDCRANVTDQKSWVGIFM